MEDILLLYVEDDINIREVYERYLKRRIKNVIVATDGKEGYELFKKHKPDLIVTDIKMPNMSGLEMSSMIRDYNRDIPIIVTSAHSDSHYFQEAINVGVNNFLLKPVDMVQLLNTITITSENIILKIKEEKDKQIVTQETKMVAMADLLSNIAHQWRQPLAAISAASLNIHFYIESEEEDNKQLLSKIESIEDCVQYLSSIIDNFKHFSNKNRKISEFDVLEKLNKCVSIESGILSSKKIKIITDFDKHIIAKGLPEEFVQAIINIINNGIDAVETSNEKIIFLSAKKIDDKVIIHIKDSGYGIKKEVKDSLFEPYVTTKHKSLGVGLGLYLSYQIITTHMKGSIQASNCMFEYEGEEYSGADFKIEFPIV